MQFIDEEFQDFASSFASRTPLPEQIVFTERLQRDLLDYSIESLKHVDKYLTFAFHNRPGPKRWVDKFQALFGNVNHELPEGVEWFNVVVWGGAYVGEVIRRNASRQYNWVAFEDWISEHPEQVQILGHEGGLQVSALLTQEDGSFTLPLNKVYKFLCAGIVESTWFYANEEVRR